MPATRPQPVTRRTFALRPLIASTLLLTAPALAQTFTPIPLSTGATSARATAISSDGATVVGYAGTPAGEVPFRWTAAGGTETLPLLAGTSTARALDVDASGTRIVGRAGEFASSRAVLWTVSPTGITADELLPTATFSIASGITPDGHFVVGYTSQGAFRWSQPGGSEQLDVLAPVGVSDDGETLVGQWGDCGVYWTRATGVVFFPNCVPNVYHRATAVNGDGTIFTGYTDSSFISQRGIRWELVAGAPDTMYLFPPGGEGNAAASAISASGHVIAGYGRIAGEFAAMLWYQPVGAHVLTRVLLTNPALTTILDSWRLREATALSADGLTIAGWGENSGVEQPWVATIPARTFCYANCDNSTVEPVLNVDDFTCFINEFAYAQSLPHAQQIASYANCDQHFNPPPILNVDDFTCFINQFAAGCP